MKTRIQAILIISSCAAIAVVSICLTVLVLESLHSNKQDINSLGQIGDFIGGTIGTLASVIGVALTLFIAISVNRLQERLARMSMDHSLELIRFQRRQQEFISFIEKCDKVIGDLNPDIEANEGRSQLGLVLEAANRISAQFKELEGDKSLLTQFAKNFTILHDQFKHHPTKLQQHMNQVKLILVIYLQLVSDLSDWVATGEIKWTNIESLKNAADGGAKS
jgi:hypothetical protein